MADSVVLTPEEQRRLRPLFSQYDLEDSSIVLGERVRPLLEKSGLQPVQLGQIWQIVDTENRGFLDFHGFAKCMRLIAHAQQGLALSPKMANIPSSMPDFSRPSVPAASPAETPANPQTGNHPQPTGSSKPLTSLSTGGSTFSENGETRIPPLTTMDKKRYGALFDRSAPSPNDGFIDGGLAREIFLKAKLPEDTLAKVWSLVDVEGRGKLTKNEFVVGMHLIQSLITKVMPNVPSALPATWAPWLGSTGHGRQGSYSSPVAAVQSPQNTAQHFATKPGQGAKLATQGTGPIAIAPSERAQYDSIFNSLDTTHAGILGPSEAVPLLTKSGLSEDVLAKVWDLADTRSRGQLDRGDFALAMHFVKAKLNGYELPEHVSPGAGASPPQASSGPAAAPVAPQASGSANSPAVPPEPKVPQRSSTQVTASSLTDLVSLDNAVFKPLEPAKPRRVATETDERKFVPTTSFGQQLLQKHHTQQPPAQVQSPTQTQGSSQDQPQAKQPQQQPQQQPPQHLPQQPPQPVAPQQVPNTQAQTRDVQQLDSQVAALKAEAARANEELASVLKEKADLDAKLKQLRETYDNGTKQVHETQQLIRQVREEIKQLEKDTALRTSGLDAIKTQHAQESQLYESLLKQKSELEAKHQAAQAEIESLTKETESFQSERSTHQQTITEHESLLSKYQSDVETSRWKRQQMEQESQSHRDRALQAQKAAEESMRQAQQEAAAAAEAEAKAKAEAEAADRHIASLEKPATREAPSAPTATAPTSTPSVPPAVAGAAGASAAAGAAIAESIGHPERTVASNQPEQLTQRSLDTSAATAQPQQHQQQPQQPHHPQTDPQSQQHQHLHGHTFSLGSESNTESVPLAGADTPRTSPPTSEANYGTIDSSMPTFTLPMGRPISASSSVVNNAPQSVRGDLGSEPSERQSPEFTPMTTEVPGIPPHLLGLEHRNDSFEFVDAQGSSEDEEGPVDAIPKRYGPPSPRAPTSPGRLEQQAEDPTQVPPMPGAFPKEYEQSVPSVAETARQQQPQTTDSASQSTTSFAPSPPHIPSQTQLHQQSPQPTLQPPMQAPVQSTQPEAAQQPPMQQDSTRAVQHMEPVTAADDFDEFDDLEEAREDESDVFSNPYDEVSQTTNAAGPDEWQQLFAGNNAPAASQPSHPGGPFGFGSSSQAAQSESREVAELTSMGFTVDEARSALELHGHNLGEATNYLLDRMQ